MSNELNDLIRERDLLCYRAYGTLQVLGQFVDNLPEWAKAKIAAYEKRYEEITAQLHQ